MVECPSCRAASADEARFCASCGTSLGGLAGAAAAATSSPVPAPARRQERRVVTTLFCDLVGFTAVSETADPEDLDRMLARYFAIARTAIEQHGGIVEKFIGDAVVGVFGAPTAHEDDPARAVRAGLDICAGAAELCMPDGTPLALRVGVNTGDAFVHLDVRPDSGEHLLVGDAVNTAARIQSAAPAMGVAVGVRTWQATRLAFDYERLEPVALKGKADPVELFHPRAEIRVAGVDAARNHAGPFVGREAELGRLVDAWASVRREGRARLAVLEGEPGIGKSRLLAELRAAVTRDEPGVAWRQGRCLPYGDGTGLWAFGEIVKTHAGIRDGDDAATVRERAAAMLADETDAAWLLDAMLPVLGVEGTRPTEREERLEAWRRVVRSMARGSAVVLAFEDIHWASPGLLELIETIASERDVPVLVVATTRPAVREIAPDFGARAPDAIRIALEPLDDADTEALVTGLLGDIVPHELHDPILRRSQGNPLYAEEFVRLLGDRGLLERVDGTFRLRPGASIPLPESIHGLLASRLDSLDGTERSVLTAASVVGHAFWPGAVGATAAIEPATLAATLEGLAGRQLVRPLPSSTMADEPEFAFWHVLARDVAYGSLPRAARIEAHLAVADWIRSAAAGRNDVAAIVAHHVGSAFELAQAARDADRVEAIRPRTIAALADAAAATRPLDASAAAALYRRALDAAPPGTIGRAELLYRYGQASTDDARADDAVAALEEARALFEAEGDVRGTARALTALRLPLLLRGDDRWKAVAARAVELLEPLGPSEELVAAYTERATAGLWVLPSTPALEDAQRALDVASSLGMPTPTTALQIRGQARLSMGDFGGFEDFERALSEAVASGRWAEAVGFGSNYAAYRFFHGGPAAAIPIDVEAIGIAEAHGLRMSALWRRLSLCGSRLVEGDFDEAEALLRQVEAAAGPRPDLWVLRDIVGTRADILLARGATDEMAAAADAVRPYTMVDDEIDAGLNAMMAGLSVALGDLDAAASHLWAAIGRGHDGAEYWLYLSELSRAALAVGDLEAARAIPREVSGRAEVQRCGMATNAGVIAELDGRPEEAVGHYEQAAARWSAFGAPIEVARANVGAGRCLAMLGRREEARDRLEEARRVADRIGATGVTRDAEAILASLGRGAA